MAMRALDAPHGVVERAAQLALERLEGEHAIRVAELIRRYWERVAPDDLLARDPADLFGAAMAHWQTGAPDGCPTRPPNVRLYNPDLEVDGWESRHTVVEVVCDDRPFLVDSVTMVLQRHGWGIHLVVHPVLDVERTADGELVGVGGETQESWIHLEVDRQASPESALDVRQDLLAVLDDVRSAVDRLAGHAGPRPWRIADELGRSPAAVPAEERQAAKELLDWMVDDHFTFLGYREYELVADAEGREVLRGRARARGLGVLRDDKRPPTLTRWSPTCPSWCGPASTSRRCCWSPRPTPAAPSTARTTSSTSA